jgi:hypothetical protein
VAGSDHAKLACLRAAGFTIADRLPGALNLDGSAVDVLQLKRPL